MVCARECSKRLVKRRPEMEDVLDRTADAAVAQFKPFLDFFASVVDCEGFLDVGSWVKLASDFWKWVSSCSKFLVRSNWP